MVDQITNSVIDSLSDSFDTFPMSGPDWPVVVMAAIASSCTMERWPAFPAAATLECERLGHGRGWSIDRARQGAVGELVEIASCCDWGDLNEEWKTPRDIGKMAWEPELLNGFSKSQCSERETWNTRLSSLDWIPPKVDPDREIRWLAASDAFDHYDILVPVDSVVLDCREFEEKDPVGVADTNGCAAGTTWVGAQLGAVYELIERDALSRWWYCGHPGKSLAHHCHRTAIEVAGTLRNYGRMLHLRDITSDLGVPTIAALASDANGQFLAAGFATRYNSEDALECAIMELMQMELKTLMMRSGQLPALEFENRSDAISMGDLPLAKCHIDDPYARTNATSTLGEEGMLSSCLESFEEASCRLAFIDFTRPEFGVPVARAISPDLCHWKPRFGRARINTNKEECDHKMWRI